MLNTLRRFGQPLMIALTVLTIISFAWWSPNSSNKADKSAPVAVIHGKPVSIETWQREGRVMGIHAKLGGIYTMALDPGARFGSISKTGVENSLLFEHEADALGITATPAEMEDQLSNKLPVFRGADGKFDPALFDMVAQRLLQPEGFSKTQIELFLRSEVRLRKVAELVGSLAPATPVEIKQDFLRERLTDFIEGPRFRDLLLHGLQDESAHVLPTASRLLTHALFQIRGQVDGQRHRKPRFRASRSSSTN